MIAEWEGVEQSGGRQRWPACRGASLTGRTQSVFKVVLQKSTPHKSFNVLCTTTYKKNKLTNLC